MILTGKIFLKTKRLEKNFSEEITSINEVEGEVESIVRVAGVRG